MIIPLLNAPRTSQKLQQTKSLTLAHLVIDGGAGCESRFDMIWYSVWSDWRVGWESAMSHQYKAGDVVTVFQISPENELVIEGKATIRKRVAEVDGSTGSSSPISQARSIHGLSIAGGRTILRSIYKISIGALRDSRP